MASTSSHWSPPQGRHKVSVGTSFKRALYARKGGAPPPKRGNLPDREFYSVRYYFKPSSIDTTQSGTLEVKRGNDASSNSVIVTHPSTQPGEIHEFSGNETAAKDWACALVYDEETGSFTLEKVESFIALEHPQRRLVSTSDQPSANPPSTSSHHGSTSSKNPTPPLQEDADDIFEDILPDSLLTKPSMVVVEEEIPLSQVPKPAPAPTHRLPKKPPATKARTAEVPAARPAPTKSKKPAKRQTPTFSDAEEEELEFGRPTKRTRPSPPPVPKAKKREPSPPPPQEYRLELPGTSSSYTPLPAPGPPPSKKTVSRQPQPTQPPPSSPPAAVSDSEDEWSEVDAPALAPTTTVDEGEEEMDELEALINQHLGEDDEGEVEHLEEDDVVDDFLVEAIGAGSPEPQPQPSQPSGGPISMNTFAAEIQADSNDEEEYTSSDDTDDD